MSPDGRQPDRFATVLVVHNRYRQRAGEDHAFDAEVELLRSRGHEVIAHVVDNLDIGRAATLSLAARAIWNREAYREIGELVRDHAPSVAHFHNTQPQVSPAAYYAAAAAGVPVVQTLHNYRIACPGGLLFRDGHVCNDCVGRALAWRGIVHRCYRGSFGASATVAATTAVHRLLGTWRSKVDAYIALSEFSRRKFVEAGLPADRIAVKPNFLPGEPPVRRGDEGYLLYAGRLSPEKGIGTLLAAWERAPASAKLRIVGNGPLAGMVKAACDRFANLVWLGEQPRERVFAELGGARAAILPSACYENFPLALVEASAPGVPCIASDHGAMAELIDDGRTGLLFPPGDADALARRIAEATAEPARMAALGEAAQQHFTERFSADRSYADLMRIYGMAAAHQRG